jgi:hypothetical protein
MIKFALIIFITAISLVSSMLMKMPLSKVFDRHVQQVDCMESLVDIVYNNKCKGVASLKPPNSSKVLWSPIFDEMIHQPEAVFDRSVTITDTHSDRKLIQSLLPPNFEDEADGLIENMQQLADLMLFQKKKSITCRLQLMHGIRCPKWHEDYVHLRLLQCYLGSGTEWVSPSNILIRILNNLLRFLDADNLTVLHPNFIVQAETQEILIFAGRKCQIPGSLPVLHRSPPMSSANDKRLLFTISIPE